MFPCEGKIAFLTGSLGVIGKAFTDSLLANNIKGVALIDMHEADTAYLKTIDAKYGSERLLYIKANIANKAELKEAFEQTVKHFGQLDIVINNAGIVNEDDYEACLNTNFMAVMHGTMMAIREYLPKYKTASGSGVIVNTASIAGVFPWEFPVYCISKHAIVSIGLCFANDVEVMEKDIRVLTICPGPTRSTVADNLSKLLLPDSVVRTRNMISTNADYLGESLIKIMEGGSNGSIWVCLEGKEPYEVDYQSFQQQAKENFQS